MPAPAGGIVVLTRTSNPGIAKPAAASVTVPAGAASKTFTIHTFAVTRTSTATIRAIYKTVALTAPLKVTP